MRDSVWNNRGVLYIVSSKRPFRKGTPKIDLELDCSLPNEMDCLAIRLPFLLARLILLFVSHLPVLRFSFCSICELRSWFAPATVQSKRRPRSAHFSYTSFPIGISSRRYFVLECPCVCEGLCSKFLHPKGDLYISFFWILILVNDSFEFPPVASALIQSCIAAVVFLPVSPNVIKWPRVSGIPSLERLLLLVFPSTGAAKLLVRSEMLLTGTASDRNQGRRAIRISGGALDSRAPNKPK